MAARSEQDKRILPSQHQAPLPLKQLLISDTPSEEALPMDVIFVGGGPAGLAGAIELARLARQDPELSELEIGVVEKAGSLGEHSLSGAVINPAPFRELFPDLQDKDFPFRGQVKRDRVYFLTSKRRMRVWPAPQSMHNRGNYVASLCEVVRWLGERAEELGVNVFAGFPADGLLTKGERVVGIRTTPAGLGPDGAPGPNHMPATDLTAQVTVLADGSRGHLTQAYLEQHKIGSFNPQIYALGVKELWEIKQPLDAVMHTLGWPLPRDAFGGSWLYPMGDNLVSLGLVVGLDYQQQTLDAHVLLQKMKQHPMFSKLLEGGEMLEWGAKTIPEGGFHSLPERLHGDGVLMIGDAAGFVDVASLKGVHYAVQSGMLAARSIYAALKSGDTSGASLKSYDDAVKQSVIYRDLERTRNMRLAFKSGFWTGGFKAAAMGLTGGKLFAKTVRSKADQDEPKHKSTAEPFQPDGVLTFSKLDAVYRSGNATRDDIPSHLVVAENLPAEHAKLYEHMCPAGVYEEQDGKLLVNAPNCVDCKTTDVIGPRWLPREGGSGPKHKRM